MKITKINIPSSVVDADGLKDIKMERLGNIIILAGKNGSGKTRIMNKIFNTLASKPKNNDIENAKSQINYQRELIKANETAISNWQLQLNSVIEQELIKNLNINIENCKNAITNSVSTISNYKRIIEWNLIETSELKDYYQAIHFVPKNLVLTDSSSISKDQINGYAESTNKIGVDHLPSGTFSKIQLIQERWFNATHQYNSIKEEEKQKAINDYERLKDIVNVFLNTQIGRAINGDATIFGFPLGKSNLSDGQKVLIQFCMAIYSQEIELKDFILFLDEPENHLHPSQIIEIIERIQKCATNGQIWIATHSIPLLAHFDPTSIWYVENGKVRYAGKIPEKVLQSLLGDEDEVARLQDFLSLPAQLASNRFAFECMFEPCAVETDSNDPQSRQIWRNLLELSNNGKLRILDYGVGKGRLISNIADLDHDNKEKLIEKIEYIAYDKFTEDKEHCKNALDKAFGESNNRYFNEMPELLCMYNKGSFDVIIMCNVLHEIDPKDWLKLFQPEGDISSLLNENGILLLVEDQQIPIGEKAYQKGFLVLDTLQLKELFKISESDTDFICKKYNGNERLKAHQIPKRLLIQINNESRTETLKSLRKMAREKILEIRSRESNYSNGKLHGFWTQQFANAQLNLAELDGINT